jgi:hypothetical protein
MSWYNKDIFRRFGTGTVPVRYFSICFGSFQGQKVDEEQNEPQYLSPEDAALLSLPEHLRFFLNFFFYFS